MNYLLYNLLLWTVLLVGAPIWIVLVAVRQKWRAGILERLGFVPRRLRVDTNGSAVVWVHAVSVGEVLAAAGLIRELQQNHQVFISTTTLTAQRLARARFGDERVFYFPADLPFAVRAYLQRLTPKMVVLLETEFWPNFLREAHHTAKVAVVNARISDRSLPGYERRRSFISTVLKNVDLFLAQSDEDARRLIRIGADAARVRRGGNLKFDWSPPHESPIVDVLQRTIAEQQFFPVIVAGSTVEEEEELLVLRAFGQIRESYSRARLILAPRHPERFDEAADTVTTSGFVLRRRSQSKENPLELSEDVFLLDSIGELASIYQFADIAFVGGSLVPRGGHNILEPAYFGRAITVGPHTENFRDIVAEFNSRNAVILMGAEQVAETWLHLASDDTYRSTLGECARTVMAENTGATVRTLAALKTLEVQP